jgi:hypothetical protein
MEFEIDDDDSAYTIKVGIILVWAQLDIITGNQYLNLSCNYAGYKIKGTVPLNLWDPKGDPKFPKW